MRIFSLDQSISRSGWALYDAPGHERKIRTGSFSCSDARDQDEQVELFAKHVKAIIGLHRPDFLAWESASRKISMFEKHDAPALVAVAGRRFTPNAKLLVLPKLEGVLIGLAVAYRLPHEAVGASTWRAALYGKGGGKLTTAEANARAAEYCRWLGIKAANDDEREAACIARWAATCSQRFKLLQHQREKAA